MSKMSVVAGKVLVDAQSIGMSEVEQALGLLLDDNGRPMCVSCVSRKLRSRFLAAPVAGQPIRALHQVVDNSCEMSNGHKRTSVKTFHSDSRHLNSRPRPADGETPSISGQISL